MTVRRGVLYTGVFLVAAGGVTLLAAAGVLDRTRVTDALQYWPLAIIAIGAALVLRRTSAALPAGIAAAAVPGLLFGAMFVTVPAIPDLAVPCNADAATGGTPLVREGTFTGDARVNLDLSCGELDVTTAAGNAWSIDATIGRNRTGDVSATGDRLSAGSGSERVALGWNSGADDWNVTLPQGVALDLGTTVNAGRATLDLAGARMGAVTVDVNAGEASLDLGTATVQRLDVTVNAGATTVELPATGGFRADLQANAGSVQVCVPDGLRLRVTGNAELGSINYDGLVRSGDAWVVPGSETAQASADLTVQASVGSVTISPEGVCK